MLALAPAAGASPGTPMKALMTTARLRRSHLLSHRDYLQLAHDLRAGSPSAHAAIVGGSEISIELAPSKGVQLIEQKTHDSKKG
jgi:hypothetical protein